MKRARRLAATAAGLVLLAVGACTGPPVILPPPNDPAAVDTVALVGFATYCGNLRGPAEAPDAPLGADPDGRLAWVIVVNNTNPEAPLASNVTRADECGCYEDLQIEAMPGDEIELFFFRATEMSYSESITFQADLGGTRPLACTPCIDRCTP